MRVDVVGLLSMENKCAGGLLGFRFAVELMGQILFVRGREKDFYFLFPLFFDFYFLILVRLAFS